MYDDLISRKALDEAFTFMRWDADGNLAHWGDRPDWCLHGYEVDRLISEAPAIREWVKAEDRLPSEYGNYIAFCEGEVMECTYAPPKKGMIPGWSTCDARGVHFFGEKSVTHWMPLPEPPKEDKEDA